MRDQRQSVVKPAAAAARNAPASRQASDARPTVSHVTVGAEYAGQRLDNYLLRELKGVPKTHVYRIIRSGEVRINHKRAQADTRLNAGDVLRLPPVRVAVRSSTKGAGDAASPDSVAIAAHPVAAITQAPPREFPIVFEDDCLLVLDKPAGTAVHGGSGVAFGVIEQLRRARPQAPFLELAHRLDRETSGLLIVAKRRSALTALQQQLRARSMHKVYLALVAGDWPAGQTVIDTALVRSTSASGERRVRPAQAGDLGARRSISLVRLMDRRGGYSLLAVTIKTGRTHQIRVHLAAAGHPIAGDDKYGDFALNKRLAARKAPLVALPRLFLHAAQLAFDHPGSGQRLQLAAALPPDCAAFWDALVS